MQPSPSATTNPVAELPVPQCDLAVAHLFDGCPDAEFELPGITSDIPPRDAYERKLRATVAVTRTDGEHALVGAALAHGAARVHLLETPEGSYLEVLLDWPSVTAWGEGHCEFLKERARARCLEQYAAVALELVRLEQLRLPHHCAVLSFEGDWDEHSEPLRRKLAARFVERLFHAEPTHH